MSFEDVLQNLNKRGMFLDSLGQIEDGKKWSARVRKKGSTAIGYAQGKTLDKAITLATKNIHDAFAENNKRFKDAPKNPSKQKRKRVRIKGR